MCSINFSATGRRFCLSLHYNGDNSYLFVNGKEMIKFKTKDSEIVANPLCLGNISNDFPESNMKKTGLYGSIYEFSIDHKAIAVKDILGIHKYLTKKYNLVSMFGFIKRVFFTAITFFNFSGLSVNSLECVSINNQEFKIRSEIINVNTNEPMFYPYNEPMFYPYTI